MHHHHHDRPLSGHHVQHLHHAHHRLSLQIHRGYLMRLGHRYDVRWQKVNSPRRSTKGRETYRMPFIHPPRLAPNLDLDLVNFSTINETAFARRISKNLQRARDVNKSKLVTQLTNGPRNRNPLPVFLFSFLYTPRCKATCGRSCVHAQAWRRTLLHQTC